MVERQRVQVSDGERVVAHYLPIDAHDRPAAEDVVLTAPVDEAVPALLAQLSGWYVTTDDDGLTEALLAAGATVARHAHVYSFDLVGDADRVDPAWLTPALPDGVRITPVDRPAGDVGALEVAAYPPGHADHEHTDPDQAAVLVQGLLDGSMLGPLLPNPSSLAVDGDRVVGVLLVNDMPGPPPMAGTWLTEVARDPAPRLRGLGTALIRRALAVLRDDGAVAVGLVVTEGNPAQLLYERLGFRRVTTGRRLLLP